MGDENEEVPEFESALGGQSVDWTAAEQYVATQSMENVDFMSAIEAAVEGNVLDQIGDIGVAEEEDEGEIIGVDEEFTEALLEDADCAEYEGEVAEETEETEEAEEVEAEQQPVVIAAGDRQVAVAGVPHTGVIAEVVLLMTSFGGVRRHFFSSLRARHLLDCKGIVYYVVDCNKDFSEASGLKDKELYDQWRAEGRLKKSEVEAPAKNEDNVQIPQILIDGHPIGNEVALQDLEEDGDLDWICARAACPQCLNEKDPSDVTCASCGLNLESIVPEDMVYSGHIQQLCKGRHYGALSEEVFEHPTMKSSPAPEYNHSESLTYQDLFGEPPPE
eukprot:Selendium_serpulae@DN6324_c0_g3_i3.p1